MATLIQIFILLPFITYFAPCLADIVQKELRSKELNQESALQLSPLIHSGRVNPSRAVQLSWQPRVFAYRGFLSDEECDHLISLAREMKEGTTQEQSGRSLDILGVKDETVAKIERKISAWTLIPPENSRPLQTWDYHHEEPKQIYDYFGNKSTVEISEPLMATIIVYLSTASHGGEITFPDSQLKLSGVPSKTWLYSSNRYKLLRPIKGNAILFFNVHPNASPDMSSHHVRNPVVEGEMWCATKLFYLRSINARKASSESENGDCTDEEDSCPQWAAQGECQRNPVFMVGSPDYYGTCRRSCNVC